MALRFQQVGVAAIALVLAAALSSSAKASPREEYDALKQLSAQPPATIVRGSKEYHEWTRVRSKTLHESGLKFIADYPQDPLRWDALVLLRYSIGGATAEQHSAWNRRYFTMIEEMLDSPDASRSARHEGLRQMIEYYTEAVRNDVIDNPKRGVVPALLEWVTELNTLDPSSGYLPYLYLRVARMLDALDPVRCRAFLSEKLALHSTGKDRGHDALIRQAIETFQRRLRNQDGPATDVWAYLGKLDPRFGDAAQYRDKIVLVVYDSVDSANIRRLESLHRQYHAAGLEIIQLAYFSRDKAASPPRRDRAAMERYVAEKQWPWPVLWEHAKNHRDDFHFYWGENAIPATLLIGRDGRLVRDIPGERDWDTRVQRALFGSVKKKR